jgi:hypothetical protein
MPIYWATNIPEGKTVEELHNEGKLSYQDEGGDPAMIDDFEDITILTDYDMMSIAGTPYPLKTPSNPGDDASVETRSAPLSAMGWANTGEDWVDDSTFDLLVSRVKLLEEAVEMEGVRSKGRTLVNPWEVLRVLPKDVKKEVTKKGNIKLTNSEGKTQVIVLKRNRDDFRVEYPIKVTGRASSISHLAATSASRGSVQFSRATLMEDKYSRRMVEEAERKVREVVDNFVNLPPPTLIALTEEEARTGICLRSGSDSRPLEVDNLVMSEWVRRRRLEIDNHPLPRLNIPISSRSPVSDSFEFTTDFLPSTSSNDWEPVESAPESPEPVNYSPTDEDLRTGIPESLREYY